MERSTTIIQLKKKPRVGYMTDLVLTVLSEERDDMKDELISLLSPPEPELKSRLGLLGR